MNDDMINNDVTIFLDNLKLPLRDEIEMLRGYILSTEYHLEENIKWNGPNYTFNDGDRITMKVQPPKNIQLIFHRGAKKQAQPDKKLLDDDSEFLTWKENDRAIMTFTNTTELLSRKDFIIRIVTEWLKATS